MKFTIPGRLPGLNEMTNANRANMYQGASLKKNAEKSIMAALMYQKLTPIHEPVYLRFNWVEPNKKRDKDNIASGRKFVLDALVKAGVLENDGWKHIIGFSDRFSVDKNNPRIEVELLTEAEMQERQHAFEQKIREQ